MPETRDIARASLYRGKINLWVEDELTRAYLSEVWNNPDVAFLLGGGNEGVRAVVKDAEESDFANVFAVIDRDYRDTNKDKWMDPNKTFRTFVLPVHEIENYLLDPAALSASRLNNLRKTEHEIDTMMNVMASRLCWWFACRDVVAEFRTRFRNDFLPDPKYPPVDSEALARSHICDSPWYLKLAQEFGRSTVADVSDLLVEAHSVAKQFLADGRWRDEFAGKEILRDIGSRICDRTKLKPPNTSQTSTQFDEDLAKAVGAWQRENKKVPVDLTDLLKALERRIARPRAGR